MDSAMSGRSTVSGVHKGDRVATLASPRASPATRSNSMTACDLPRAVASGSFNHSFNSTTIALPTVSLPFLDDLDFPSPSPASHSDEWHKDGTSDQQPAPHCRTPPRSPKSQAAIDKCLAAIAECKAALEQSTAHGSSDACQDDDLPRELRKSLQLPRGSAAPLGVETSSEKSKHRRLDDTPGDCARSTNSTLPAHASPSPSPAASPSRRGAFVRPSLKVQQADLARASSGMANVSPKNASPKSPACWENAAWEETAGKQRIFQKQGRFAKAFGWPKPSPKMVLEVEARGC